MAKSLSVGVVGCGYWGPNLIRNFNSLEDCRVKIACDLDQNRLAHIKTLYSGIETTTEYYRLLEYSTNDAIAIATTVEKHYEMYKI